MMVEKTRHWPFYLIAFSTFLAFISYRQWSDGMFLDGLIYASISRNMALGLGSFWSPYYTAIWPSFHEHPPLAFWLQNHLFRVMGDTLYVERIYSFLTYLLTGYIVALLWKQSVKEDKLKFGWIPILLWVLIPTVTWASPNNMLENTLMVFTCLSVYFYFRSHTSLYLLFLFLSGICISLALLVKGPIALFPLSLPFLFWVFDNEMNFSRFVVDTVSLFAITILPFVFIFYFDKEGFDSLTAYFNQQVFASLKGERETVGSRFQILFDLESNLRPPLLLMIVGLLMARWKNVLNFNEIGKNRSFVLIFCFLGLSASLPIIITMKQRSFYLIPSFPFFCLSFGLVLFPSVAAWFDQIVSKKNLQKGIKISSVLIFILIAALSVSRVGKIGRDNDEIESVREVLTIVPKDSVISIAPDMNTIWGLHAQYARYGNVTLDPSSQHFFLLLTKNHLGVEGYSKISLKTSVYELYKKTPTN
jgi:hypothetical protein